MSVVSMTNVRRLAAGVALVASASGAGAQQPTARIVSAANRFLATLDQQQQGAVSFAFDDDAQRARWSNFPVRMTPRAGLKLGDLSAAQRSAAMSLLSSVLSARGYEKTQRKQAILGYHVGDLVLGPGQDGKTIQPEGLKASAMTERQRAMLLEVIAEWSGIVHESAAAARMAEIKADLGNTWFAWSGPTTATTGQNITAYYRIQGPKLVIEYAPQRLGGDLSMHVH